MKRFSKSAIIFISATALKFGTLATVAVSASDERLFGLPDGHRIREDVQVVLKIPYEVVLRDENAHLFLGIKNHSEIPLTLDRRGDLEVQYFVQARTGPQGENLTKPEFIPEWGKLDEEIFWFSRALQEGESVVYWNSSALGLPYDRIPPGTQEIRYGILTNPEEWAFSNWVPIRRLDDRLLQDEEVIFEYQDHGFTIPVRQVEIEGDEYLFNSRFRFARLPKGATPRFEVFLDQWGVPYLRTHFDGVDVPPQITDIPVALEREWTPEIAPHATVLQELRAELQGEMKTSDAPARTKTESEEANPGATKMPVTSEDLLTEPPADQGTDRAGLESRDDFTRDSLEEHANGHRVWLMLFILALVGAGMVLIRKRKCRE